MILVLIPARMTRPRALALVFALGLDFACANAAAFAASPTAPQLAHGVMHFCTTGDYRPYSYYRPDGRFEGIDIDLAKSLARSLKVRTSM